MTNTTLDLFAPAEKPKHDPGGKVEIPLPPGMIGDAEFYGENDQYRPSLARSWNNAGDRLRVVMWIGMNPSTARGDVNDPTILREIGFSKALGFNDYIKCNVMDYRATNPKVLRSPGVNPRSDRNIPTILHYARMVEKIICASGVPPHKSLAHYAEETYAALREAGHGRKMFCLGRTLMGHPRHPLYLKADSALETFL